MNIIEVQTIKHENFAIIIIIIFETSGSGMSSN